MRHISSHSVSKYVDQKGVHAHSDAMSQRASPTSLKASDRGENSEYTIWERCARDALRVGAAENTQSTSTRRQRKVTPFCACASIPSSLRPPPHTHSKTPPKMYTQVCVYVSVDRFIVNTITPLVHKYMLKYSLANQRHVPNIRHKGEQNKRRKRYLRVVCVCSFVPCCCFRVLLPRAMVRVC